MNTETIELINGEISIWIEQGQSLCIKATTEYGDPVELSCDEAKELATRLLELANSVDK